MQHIAKLLKDAEDRMLRADHLTFMTYPELKEPKILALVVEQVSAIMMGCMEALMYYERMYKRIDPVKMDFEGEFRVLRSHCFRRYGIPDGMARVMLEVKSLAEKKRDCPMEFRKGDKYVLCRNDFKMDVINIKAVREYVNSAKSLLESVRRAVR